MRRRAGIRRCPRALGRRRHAAARPRRGRCDGRSLTVADMTATLGTLTLPNPVLTASGCAAAGRELAQFFDVAELGAVVTKSIMVEARSGRATPRMAETPSGMLNSIGLQGPGIETFVNRDLAWLSDHGARAVVSIAGHNVEEYGKLAQRLRSAQGVAA